MTVNVCMVVFETIYMTVKMCVVLHETVYLCDCARLCDSTCVVVVVYETVCLGDTIITAVCPFKMISW